MNNEFKIIELTHRLLPEVPTWDGTSDFNLHMTLDYGDCTPPDVFRKHEVKMQSGTGTHMDAPAHVVVGGRTIDQLTLPELVSDCVVIDVSVQADANYVAMPAVVEEFEKQYGEIKPNSFVIFYTGWDKRWGNREKYNNDHKFPSVDISTAELLLKRNITGLGIDTLSADTGTSGFPVHRAILGADKYLVENVANAKELPPTGAKIFVLPIKIKDATEAPIRLIATI
jgi:kynurenine formamidase